MLYNQCLKNKESIETCVLFYKVPSKRLLYVDIGDKVINSKKSAKYQFIKINKQLFYELKEISASA